MDLSYNTTFDTDRLYQRAFDILAFSFGANPNDSFTKKASLVLSRLKETNRAYLPIMEDFVLRSMKEEVQEEEVQEEDAHTSVEEEINMLCYELKQLSDSYNLFIDVTAKPDYYNVTIKNI